eukprot:1153343-Pelagomonas_calceolata.AAC.4
MPQAHGEGAAAVPPLCTVAAAPAASSMVMMVDGSTAWLLCRQEGRGGRVRLIHGLYRVKHHSVAPLSAGGASARCVWKCFCVCVHAHAHMFWGGGEGRG